MMKWMLRDTPTGVAFLRARRFWPWIWGIVLLLAAAGCAHYPINQPLKQYDPQVGYRGKNLRDPAKEERLLIFLSFSGGGTRAAAFSYGVLETLRDTTVSIHGQKRRLLDEVDGITGVSGGSFTAAYYGLFRDRIFEDFETRFLKQNIQGKLTRATFFNPINWVDWPPLILIAATWRRNITTSMSSMEPPLMTCSLGKNR